MMDKYEDIIHHKRPISKKRIPMPVENRAAQFAPFAALTGHDAAVQERARMTEKPMDLDDHVKIILDHRLNILKEELLNRPKIKITYFIEDRTKDGGEHATLEGIIKKICNYRELIIMEDETKISIRDITDIEGDIFNKL